MNFIRTSETQPTLMKFHYLLIPVHHLLNICLIVLFTMNVLTLCSILIYTSLLSYYLKMLDAYTVSFFIKVYRNSSLLDCRGIVDNFLSNCREIAKLVHCSIASAELSRNLDA